jgi:hypothetical protein
MLDASYCQLPFSNKAFDDSNRALDRVQLFQILRGDYNLDWLIIGFCH